MPCRRLAFPGQPEARHAHAAVDPPEIPESCGPAGLPRTQGSGGLQGLGVGGVGFRVRFRVYGLGPRDRLLFPKPECLGSGEH